MPPDRRKRVSRVSIPIHKSEINDADKNDRYKSKLHPYMISFMSMRWGLRYVIQILSFVMPRSRQLNINRPERIHFCKKYRRRSFIFVLGSYFMTHRYFKLPITDFTFLLLSGIHEEFLSKWFYSIFHSNLTECDNPLYPVNQVLLTPKSFVCALNLRFSKT